MTHPCTSPLRLGSQGARGGCAVAPGLVASPWAAHVQAATASAWPPVLLLAHRAHATRHDGTFFPGEPRSPWTLGERLGSSTFCLRVAEASVSEADLDALMRRLAQGERAAFAGVFAALWPPMQRFCASLLGSEADAADAAQEAMKKIFERAASYDSQRPAMPWAMAIAGWECRTLARKHTRRREVDAPLGHAEEDGWEQLAATLASPHDEVAKRRLISAALAALGQLPATDQAVLLSTFWEEAGLSAPEVDGATLRKRRERAVARLRKTWRRLYGADD